MNIDPTWLFLSLIPSAVGFVAFVYGKKQERWAHAVAGVALMLYPYFATSTLALIVIGLAIGCAWWLAVRLGW